MRHVSWGLLVTSRPFHFVIEWWTNLNWSKVSAILSLLRRGLFVLWGGFCVVGRLGRKKKRTHRPPRAFYFFDYWYFDGDTQREPLRRREGLPYLPCHRIFKSCKPGVEIWEQMRFFIRSWPEEALIRNKVQPVKFRWYEHWGGGGGREGEGGWSTERVRIYSVSEFRESVRAFFPQGQGKLFLLSVLSGYP